MNVKTDIRAGQDGTIDVDTLSALVKELDCQVSPLEMISMARKYCQNFNLAKVGEIMQLMGEQGL